MGKAKKLAEGGDDGHLGDGHVCAKCRCSMRAGYGTWGWYYWQQGNKDGLGEVGHYGVGPCWYHGQGKRDRFKRGALRGVGDLEAQVENEINAMREFGAAPDGKDMLVSLTQSTEVSKLRDDAQDAVAHVRKVLSEWKRAVNGGERLTEKGRGGPVEMSDATRIGLDIQIARALSELTRNDFLMAKNDYVHRDELESFIYKILKISESFIRTEEEWKEFMSLFKNALVEVKSAEKPE